MNKVKRIYNLIKEKLLQLLHRGFFHIFGASTINKIIGFASAWIIVRLVSKSEYGVYTYANNIYSFFHLVSGLGIASAILQVCSESKEKNEKDRFYYFGLRFGIGINILLGIVIALVSVFIPLPIEGSNILLLLMCALPIVTIIPELQYMYLRVNSENKEYASITLFNSIIVLLFSCAGAFIFKTKGLIFAGYIAHIGTMLAAGYKFKAPFWGPKTQISSEEKKSIFSIAFISMLNTGLGRLMYLLDVFVLGIYITDSTVIAAYKVATNIPTALQFIPASIVVFVYPYFAQNKDNKRWLQENYKKLVIPFGAFNIVISLAMVLLAKPIISIMFGVQYLDAVTPFRILSIGYFFSATFRTISGNLLVTQRKLKFNLFVSVFSSAMNTVLNVIMINKWASNGAAIATLLTSLTSGIISTVYLLFVFSKKSKSDILEG